MNSLNPQALSLPKPEKPAVQDGNYTKELPTHFPGKRYFAGPIPWDWLCAASRLPGKAVNVALGIWHLGRLTKKKTVRLSQKTMRELGINRNAVYRGLENLEKAGLIHVDRQCGKNSIITIRGVQVSVAAR